MLYKDPKSLSLTTSAKLALIGRLEDCRLELQWSWVQSPQEVTFYWMICFAFPVQAFNANIANFV